MISFALHFRTSYGILSSLYLLLLTACQTRPPSFEGREISRTIIRAKGPDAIEGEKKVLSIISSKPKTFYSTQKVQTDIIHLYESAGFKDVRIEPKFKGEKVDLIINVQTRERAGPSLFVGNSVFSDQRLGKITKLNAKNWADPIARESACRRIEQYYVSHGYPRTKVSVSTNRYPDSDHFHFCFVIEEGTFQGKP